MVGAQVVTCFAIADGQNCRYYAPRHLTLIYINAVLDRIVGIWQNEGVFVESRHAPSPGHSSEVKS